MNAENNNQEMLELLSAYLDDELTDGQRDKVEQMLAEDVRARSLLENLRDASAAVSGLGVEEVPRDITDEVLYALERDTLLDGNEDLAVMAGERHLRMRQFMGAAGIMILVGAVVVVVFSIMKNPAMVDSGSGPLAKNDTDNQIVADILENDEASGSIEGDQGVRYKSFGDAARSLAVAGKSDSEVSVEETMSESDDISNVVLEDEVELPTLPPMPEFVLPEARCGTIKLSSEIAAGDAVVIERLKNLVVKYGGSYLSGSGTELHSFAFVCKSGEFASFYVELRDVLSGEIALVLDDQGGYQRVVVNSITGDEVGMIAQLADGGDQLGLAEMIVAGGRMDYVEKEVVDSRPLWAQMEDIVPEWCRIGISEIDTSGESVAGDDVEGDILVASSKVGTPAVLAAEEISILGKALVKGVQEAEPMLGVKPAKEMHADVVEAETADEGVLSVRKVEESESPKVIGFVANEAVEVSAVGSDKLADEAVEVVEVIESENRSKEKADKVKADFIAVELLLTVGSVGSGEEVPVQNGEIDGRIEFGF